MKQLMLYVPWPVNKKQFVIQPYENNIKILKYEI